MVADQGGSVDLAVEATPGASAVSGSRSYDPYGRVRNHDGDDFATDRGFVGQIEDSTTDLSYLNARYYDAGTGIFISTDPLYDTGQPKTLNPYTYAGGNPTTYSDPSGLILGKIGKKASRAVGGGKKGPIGRIGQSASRAVGGGKGPWGRVASGVSGGGKKGPWGRVGQSVSQVVSGRHATLQAMRRSNPSPAYWHKLARDIRALQAMRRANPNPAFWKALGNGQIGQHPGIYGWDNPAQPLIDEAKCWWENSKFGPGCEHSPGYERGVEATQPVVDGARGAASAVESPAKRLAQGCVSNVVRSSPAVAGGPATGVPGAAGACGLGAIGGALYWALWG